MEFLLHCEGICFPLQCIFLLFKKMTISVALQMGQT